MFNYYCYDKSKLSVVRDFAGSFQRVPQKRRVLGITRVSEPWSTCGVEC